MELLNYINSHNDWENELSNFPYSLKISHDGPYVLFKYQQFISDMSLQICQEARGAIFRYVNNKFIPISIAMYKFFNAAERYSTINSLDWKTATISEKIDGSLIRLAYDKFDNNWLLSSNGTIYAHNVDVANTNFEEIFISIIGGQQEYKNLLNQLDKNYCYFFEMVSSYNVICVHYDEAGIYYLGRRNMITLEEDNEILEYGNIKHPKTYNLYSLSDCITAANEFKEDFEGFVVKDAEWHRVKIKTPWYIVLHKLRGNGPLTILRVVEMWQNDTLDDFVAYYPEMREFTDDVIQHIRNFITQCDFAWNGINKDSSRADFAREANTYKPVVRAYLFAHLDHKIEDSITYFKNMRARALATHLATEMKRVKVGVEDDE